jgi:hypothetical protein
MALQDFAPRCPKDEVTVGSAPDCLRLRVPLVSFNNGQITALAVGGGEAPLPIWSSTLGGLIPSAEARSFFLALEPAATPSID